MRVKSTLAVKEVKINYKDNFPNLKPVSKKWLQYKVVGSAMSNNMLHANPSLESELIPTEPPGAKMLPRSKFPTVISPRELEPIPSTPATPLPSTSAGPH